MPTFSIISVAPQEHVGIGAFLGAWRSKDPNSGYVSGYWTQNHVGTIETAQALADEYTAKGRGTKHVVTDAVSCPLAYVFTDLKVLTPENLPFYLQADYDPDSSNVNLSMVKNHV